MGEARDPIWWDAPFRSVVDGRRVIVAAATTRTGAAVARSLATFGATTMVYALSPGPSPEGIRTVTVDEPMGDEPDALAAHWQRHTDHLSPAAMDAIDDFDPDRSAIVFRVLGAEPHELAGRPVVARRADSWVALEDKTVIDAFWDRHDVPRKPSTVVPIGEARAAASRFDEGNGTVWAADARDHVHGGASLTRWVRTASDADEVFADFRPHCDLVRIMPFVEGVPCSVHGVVTPDGIAVLRPVEMVVLRAGTRFVFLGSSTYWDPPDDARSRMRDVARRAGTALRTEVGFRGAFTIDGVLDEDGMFWPSEMNPRVGGGLQAILEAPAAPPLLLFELLVAGVDIGLTAPQLERELLTLADSHRSALFQLFRPVRHHNGGGARFRDGDWAWCTDEEDGADVTLTASDIGVIAALHPGVLDVGASAAPLAASLTRFVDAEFATDFGELVPAPAMVDPT